MTSSRITSSAQRSPTTSREAAMGQGRPGSWASVGKGVDTRASVARVSLEIKPSVRESRVDTSRPLVPVALGTALVLVTYVTPIATIPATAADLGAGPVARAWILSSMSVGLAGLLLASGVLGDTLGRRRVYVARAGRARRSAPCSARWPSSRAVRGRPGRPGRRWRRRAGLRAGRARAPLPARPGAAARHVRVGRLGRARHRGRGRAGRAARRRLRLAAEPTGSPPWPRSLLVPADPRWVAESSAAVAKQRVDVAGLVAARRRR